MKHTKRRAFFLALGISLFLFITAVGFVVVDYQGRRLSFGESQPPLWLRRLPGGRYTLEVDLLGVEASLDATGLGRARDFLLDFLCLPHSCPWPAKGAPGGRCGLWAGCCPCGWGSGPSPCLCPPGWWVWRGGPWWRWAF